MLQQTRALVVIPYYEKFLERFPTAPKLAGANEPELLRCWSGLGYYQRARNLREAARRIVDRGAFPQEYDAIRDLPGVGPYTAAAPPGSPPALPLSLDREFGLHTPLGFTCSLGAS